jgi:hypothetical protein
MRTKMKTNGVECSIGEHFQEGCIVENIASS